MCINNLILKVFNAEVCRELVDRNRGLELLKLGQPNLDSQYLHCQVDVLSSDHKFTSNCVIDTYS